MRRSASALLTRAWSASPRLAAPSIPPRRALLIPYGTATASLSTAPSSSGAMALMASSSSRRPQSLPLSLSSSSPTFYVAVRHLAKGAKKQKKEKADKKGKKAAAAATASDDDEDDGEGGEAKVDIEAVKQQMGRPLDHLHKEYAAMQTGRATPNLLDAVLLDGVALPKLAKILAQGPQTLQVACYDAAQVASAAKAIEDAPLGLRAEPQGKVIRVHVPRATQETRQALAKHVKVLAEAAKTAIRGARQKAMKAAKGEATEEQRKRSEKAVEEATQAAIASVDGAMKAKEKDVLTVGT